METQVLWQVSNVYCKEYAGNHAAKLNFVRGIEDMNIFIIKLRGLLVPLLCAMLSLNSACAMEPKHATDNSANFTQSYIWYDGDRKQEVWLDPRVVAEFDPSSQGETSVRSINPAALIMPTKHHQMAIRLWQMDNTANGAIRNLKARHPNGKFSAVLHDGPSGAGRMRALPGNIIVYLDPQWGTAQVDGWLSAHKLEVVRQLEIGPNIYVIKTGPGLEALDTANALYQSGEVKAAFPDWWQEVIAR
jgi:hypothetical protein